ncbi:hypothetical protein [Pseudonocardia sp.]|uniref:hypothetical protein n=1 Tax=Pseudonocardia sp. TaxID=60912 RepID=UPI003D13D5D5
MGFSPSGTGAYSIVAQAFGRQSSPHRERHPTAVPHPYGHCWDNRYEDDYCEKSSYSESHCHESYDKGSHESSSYSEHSSSSYSTHHVYN